MKLFKNVDIADLESIVKKGILSLDECGNNNWDAHRRAKNPTDRVYLFNPKEANASYTNYGAALLEVDVPAEKSEMLPNDVHKDDYEEYTVSRVEPAEIKAILIPRIFKSRIDLPENVLRLVKWCEMSAKHYDAGRVPAPEAVLKRFAETAPIMSTEEFNFFRGSNPNRTMIDLYDVKYF